MSSRLVQLCVILLAACAGNDSRIEDRLDTLTGVTITFSDTPMIFYRDESGKAAHARNFINMGPIEVNRMGDYRYYLWLGIWNTLQDDADGEIRDGFESVVIFANGEPFALELAGWTAAAIGASEDVYVRPVASAADAYYEVTVDQLRLIASASDLRILPTGPNAQSFELWDHQKAARSGFIKFLRESVY